MGDVHHAVLGFVKESALFDEIGLVGRARPAVTARLHREMGNKNLSRKESVGWPHVLCYSSEGSLEDLACTFFSCPELFLLLTQTDSFAGRLAYLHGPFRKIRIHDSNLQR